MLLIFDPVGLTGEGTSAGHGCKAISNWLERDLGARKRGIEYRVEIDTEDVQAFVDTHITAAVRRHLQSTRLHRFEYVRADFAFCYACFNDLLPRSEWDERQEALRYERRLGLGLMARLSLNQDAATAIARYLK